MTLLSRSGSRRFPPGCIAITPGEPAGIGPDITLVVAQQATRPLIVVASEALMAERAQLLGIDIRINNLATGTTIERGALNLLPVALRAPVTPGVGNTANAEYVMETLEQAVQLCEQGACQAMVTGPVNKALVNDAGIPFSGHTEWLAERTATPQVVMMLATEGMKVALVTTHLPLQAVPAAITRELLTQVITILDSDLRRRFGMPHPRILVLGLNPHAGEGGHLGREEIDVIIPVVSALAAKGIHVSGPLPADTAFTPRVLGGCDVVLAMYHDQGLPVLKFKGFGDAVNITLGLPIIRTSVDHGTAFDLAGTGKADHQSMNTAITFAAMMAGNHC